MTGFSEVNYGPPCPVPVGAESFVFLLPSPLVRPASYRAVVGRWLAVGREPTGPVGAARLVTAAVPASPVRQRGGSVRNTSDSGVSPLKPRIHSGLAQRLKARDAVRECRRARWWMKPVREAILSLTTRLPFSHGCAAPHHTNCSEEPSRGTLPIVSEVHPLFPADPIVRSASSVSETSHDGGTKPRTFSAIGAGNGAATTSPKAFTVMRVGSGTGPGGWGDGVANSVGAKTRSSVSRSGLAMIMFTL